MHPRTILLRFPIAFAILCLCLPVASSSQEPKKVDPLPSKPQAANTQNPSSSHALAALKVDEGTWEAEVSFWFRPGAQPIKSHAVVNSRMALSGMYLEQRFDGVFGPEMGNKPWSSLSFTGFNASTNEYEATRMASSSSTMILVRGKATASGEKGLAMELTGDYTLMGAKATERDVIRHEGNDKCIIESWMSFGGSPEFKGAEMVLTRITLPTDEPNVSTNNAKALRLGNFSVSLKVKDLGVSRAFYEKLGYRFIGGNQKNYVILQNDASTIGLFQGMLDGNLLTFNPGWDRSAASLTEFDDVREIQRILKEHKIELKTAADESSSGPASLVIVDPDGNQILIDQHVSKPE